MPKLSRYSLGNKIDDLFLGFIETVYFALYSSKENRDTSIQRMSKRLDLLKLFLQIGWEVNLLDNKKYSAVSIPLSEVGKIIGEWKKQTKE
ncbi:MAG: four helix bundle protein [Patescibacteria group bacterium]